MASVASSALESLHGLKSLEARQLQYWDKGSLIPMREKGCWQIYRGIIQMSQLTDNGEEILLGWVQSGGFLGMDLTPEQLDTYQSRSLTDVYLRWYANETIAGNPALAQLLLTQTVQRLRQSESLLAIAGYKRVDERLQIYYNCWHGRWEKR